MASIFSWPQYIYIYIYIFLGLVPLPDSFCCFGTIVFTYFACKLPLISVVPSKGRISAKIRITAEQPQKETTKYKRKYRRQTSGKKNKSGTTAKFQVVTQYRKELPQSKKNQKYKSFGQEENRIFQKKISKK